MEDRVVDLACKVNKNHLKLPQKKKLNWWLFNVTKISRFVIHVLNRLNINWTFVFATLTYVANGKMTLHLSISKFNLFLH